MVLEAGDGPGAAVREWGTSACSPPGASWSTPPPRRCSPSTGWQRPDPATYPTGAEWVERYLAPLAEALDATAEVEVRFGHRVVGVAKQGRDRMVDSGREDAPFTVHVRSAEGTLAARPPAPSSTPPGPGTAPTRWARDGLPAPGEAEHAARITYGIPDFTDPADPARYAGKRVAVAGRGASAQNTLVGLTSLTEEADGTEIVVAAAAPGLDDAFGGGDNDQLEARGALGKRAQAAVEGGPVAGRHVASAPPRSPTTQTAG